MFKVQYNQHKRHFGIWDEAMEAKFNDEGNDILLRTWVGYLKVIVEVTFTFYLSQGF